MGGSRGAQQGEEGLVKLGFGFFGGSSIGVCDRISSSGLRSAVKSVRNGVCDLQKGRNCLCRAAGDEIGGN